MSFTADDIKRWHKVLAAASGTLSLAIVRRSIGPTTLRELSEAVAKVGAEMSAAGAPRDLFTPGP